MRSAIVGIVSTAGLFALTSCGDASGPTGQTAQAAKGGPPTSSIYPISVILGAAGGDLVSDGKGTYQTEVCGVTGWGNYENASWSFIMSPTGSNIARSDAAACLGIAPRAATMRLLTRHVSDNPHVDEDATTGSGTFNLGNLKLPAGGATVINAGPACFHVGKSGRLSGLGLRLDAENFPGSNDLIREELGGGQWHVYSAPWPNNRAYCEDDSGISYWHVNVDITINVLPQ